MKAGAQHPYSYSFNERHSFGSNEIYYLHQDKKGNIWIGCNDGLYKYNGISFRQFTHPEQSSRSISFIREDSLGRIWCQNFTGQIFCIDNDVMSVAFDASSRLSYYPVFDIDKAGNLFIGGQNEILVYGKDKKLKAISLSGDDRGVVSAIGCLADGSVIAVSDKIYKYSESKISILTKTNNATVFSKIARRRGNFEYLGEKLLFFCEIQQSEEYCLAEIKGDSVLIRSQLPNSITQGRLYNINAISWDELWLNTQKGTLCVNANLQTWYDNTFFSGSNVSDIIKDNEGNYWVATLESGIHIVPNMNIIQYTKDNSRLLDNNSTCLYLDAGKLFVGYFIGEVSVLQGVRNEKLNYDKSKRFTSAEKIDKSPVSDLMVFCHNYLSFGTGGSASSYNLDYPYNVRDFAFMPDGNILYANSESAGIVFLEGNHADTVIKLREMSSRCVSYDIEHKQKWIGFNDGVYYFDEQSRSFELLHNGKKVFASCMKYINGIVWIGTVSDGLLGIRDGKVLHSFSEQDQLRGKNVRVITQDANMLWVATEKGINIIDPRAKHISCIDKYDGLPATEINDIAMKGDTVIIASTWGLFTFPKSLKNDNVRRPDIFICKVLVNDKELSYKEPLDLAYDHNKLTVYFHTSGLGEKNTYTYCYMLQGYDSVWQKVGRNADHINYSSLPPGEYTFRIKTINEDGYESARIANFRLEIEKPVWQRWWFYILIVAGSIVLVSLIFANRIRAIKNKARLEQLIRSSQLTALKAQMNPHFVFNALNSIQDLMLRKDVRSSSVYLGRFSELMRNVLEASDKDKISIQEEIDILSLYLELEKLRFGEMFTYTVSVSPDIDTLNMYIPSMVIQPFVENAIKHGLLHKEGAKKLQIFFVLQIDCIECNITDNGVGRKASAEIRQRSRRPHTGFAIKATEKRLDLLNDYQEKKIRLQIIDMELSGQAMGTAVKLILPLERSSS